MPGIVDELKALRSTVEQVQATDSVANDPARKSLARSSHVPARDDVIGAPSTRLKGHENHGNPLSSAPFSYKNIFALLTGNKSPNQCPTEIEVVDGFIKALQSMYPDWVRQPGAMVFPISAELVAGMDSVKGPQILNTIKSLGFVNGEANVDQEEISQTRQKYGLSNPATKSMGTLNFGQGGSLVPNPAWGDFIRLARNTPGMFGAGASTVAIPPQGAIDFPRAKTATEVDVIDGEGDTIVETELGTDKMTLQAKVFAGIVTLSNKLMMMSTPAAETIVQEDLILSVLLLLDKLSFFGGGGLKPLGVVNQPGVQKITPSTVSADGDTLAPEDWFNKFWTVSAQANREFTGWICNPRAYAQTVTVRADAVTASDHAGPYVNLGTYHPMGIPLGRQLENLFGYKVTWTNQIPVNGVKGNSSNLSWVFGGPWNEAVCGIFGAVQALLNPFETTAFNTFATKVRVTCLGDFGLRYPAAFSYAEKLKN